MLDTEAQSFVVGVTINDLTMARCHCRSKLSSFVLRRPRSTTTAYTIGLLVAFEQLAYGSERSPLGFDWIAGLAALICAVRWAGNRALALNSSRRGWRALTTSFGSSLVCPLSLHPCLMSCRFANVASCSLIITFGATLQHLTCHKELRQPSSQQCSHENV